MKKLLLLLTGILLASCETEQQTCICENAKFFIPRSEQRDSNPPEQGLPYVIYNNIELDCETQQPLVLPTENAVYLGCE